MRTDLINISLVFVALLTFASSLLVLTKVRTYKVTAVMVFITCISLSVWTLSIYLFRQATDADNARMFLRIIYTIGLVIPLAILSISMRFPVKRKINLSLVILISGALGVMLVDLWKANRLIMTVEINKSANTAVLGPGYYLWISWFVVVSGRLIWNLYKTYSHEKGLAKTQAKYMFLSFLPAFVGSLPCNVILPAFGVFKCIWVGPICQLLTIGIISYTLLSFRFLSPKSLYKKMMYYILLSGTLALIFAAVFSLETRGRIGQDSFTRLVISLFGIVLLVFCFRFFEKGLRPNLDPVGNIAAPHELNRLLLNINSEIRLDELYKLLRGGIEKMVCAEVIAIVIKPNASEEIGSGSVIRRDLLKGADREILVYEEILEKSRHIRVERNGRSDEILSFMEFNKLGIVVPIWHKGSYKGYIFIGHKNDRSAYSVEDINAIKLICSNASVSFARALLYTELCVLNKNLERRVSSATKGLKQKVGELEKARQREQQILNIMGHEIRSPATVAKCYLGYLEELVLEGDGKTEDISGAIENALSAVDYQYNTAQRFIASAKLSKGVFDMDLGPMDLKALVEEAVNGWKVYAKGEGVDLCLRQGEAPKIIGDKIAVRHIVHNLVENAIKFTDKGKVDVGCSLVGDKVVLAVRDSGIGMTRSDLKKLGRRFFRSDDKKVQSIRGTGLGLYVVYKYVKAIKGKISVSSQVGRGTTFNVFFRTASSGG